MAESKEERYNDSYEERIRNYCLMDDVYFRTFMRDNYPAAELIPGPGEKETGRGAETMRSASGVI